jgi:tRNA (guanine-N7-)-methyltransferase
MITLSVSPILAFVKIEIRPIHQSAIFLSSRNEEVGLPPRTPWERRRSAERITISKRSERNRNRCRQHVNPLASQYQQQTILPDNWPRSDFLDPSKPLHVDIGCGKGGFLFDFAVCKSTRDSPSTPRSFQYNHLGLEIRPPVVQLAKSRLGTLQGHVDIIGCNANVDLDRILSLYPGPLQLVTIQFPDPHFKAQHAKRRVVRPELAQWLAKHLTRTNGTVVLQSDIQSVLDEMRSRFAECDQYFVDCQPPGDYISENPFGVPTEREVSVLERGLPVYRAMFRRNDRDFREGQPSVSTDR